MATKRRVERWGGHRQKRKRLSWTRFAELMDSLAYGK
jgi:hypothetical protein